MANQSQHAGTIADPIPQRLLYKKGDKVYTVATGPSTSGPTSDVVEATDTRKGITRLSDAIDSDSNAATGVTAATPLAVKTVHDKVTALEAKDAEQDKKLESVENTLTDHDGRLDALESGGSGGGMSYVVTPKILTPANDAVGQNTKITIIGSGYENVFPTDARKHRIFELSKVPDFGTKLETKEVDADSIKFDSQLDAQTKYYVRIKDVSQKEYRSNWSPVVEFTTGDVTHANTPVITLKGYADSPTDIGSGLTIEGGAYSVNDSSEDTHKASSWSIRLKNGRANVWESLNDTTNKTSIEVPKGTLQKSTAYVVTVIYHSTNFNDSSPAEHEFTTSNDFGTVQAPVITISGEPNKILETPSFSGGVFSCTRDPDTHEATEIQVIKSQDQSTVWTHTAGGITSVTIPKGKLTVSTQYKVKMRYKGQSYGWSAWAEKDFTTAANFIRYLHIGIPGTSTFGVGLATTEVLNSISTPLIKLPYTETPDHFQYGLYTADYLVTSVRKHVANLKCIPKFYFAYLQKDRDGTNLNDSELDALLPYVEVTKEQMKEAQRRSPYNAIVIAPADAFADRNEAQQHGFILPRGFIDGGKEKPCFFVANTLSLYTSSDNCAHHGYKQISNSDIKFLQCDGEYTNYAHQLASPMNALREIRRENYSGSSSNDDYTFISIFAWSVLCLLSLVQGQYATSTDDCAWYDSSLLKNYPKGINNTNVDVDDSTVRTNTNGDAFVDESVYAKTTHNGSINGITHVNGWMSQPTLGIGKPWSYLFGSIKESKLLRNFTSENLGSEYMYDPVANIFNDKADGYWAKTNKSPLFREASGEKWVLNGVFSDSEGLDSTQSSISSEFSKCSQTVDYGYTLQIVGGASGEGSNAGLFYRKGIYWDSQYGYVGVRVMAYPNIGIDSSVTA